MGIAIRGDLGAAIPCGMASAAMALATRADAERPEGLRAGGGLGAALALGSSVVFGGTGALGIALASGSSGWPDSPWVLASGGPGAASQGAV